MMKVQENNGSVGNICQTCVIENKRTRRTHLIAQLYILCLRRVTALIPQTTDLLLYFPAFLKLLKASCYERSLYQYNVS